MPSLNETFSTNKNIVYEFAMKMSDDKYELQFRNWKSFGTTGRKECI